MEYLDFLLKVLRFRTHPLSKVDLHHSVSGSRPLPPPPVFSGLSVEVGQ